MKVLLVNDDPNSCYRRLAKAFADAGVSAEVTIARNSVEAREWLPKAEEIDVVFMDYDLREIKNTISSGLIQAFVDAGFGVGKKPLVAASRSGNNVLEAMLRAGCSHKTDWVMFSPEGVVRQILKK